MNRPEFDSDNIMFLRRMAQTCRQDVLDMVMWSREGHFGGAYSCLETLTTLYFQVMRLRPDQPDWEDRDRFIMSKGHACYALYAVLARRGFFPLDLLRTVNQEGTIFAGHPDMGKVPGVEVSTGSLGHGLSIGAGMALANRLDGRPGRVFVLMGDGECQEGSVWEAAMFAAARGLSNLTAIIDANALQAIDRVENILPLEPLEAKWQSFGWNTVEIDGHDPADILRGLGTPPARPGRPTAVIARTVKGKGVSFMENQIQWHARPTTPQEYEQAHMELLDIPLGGLNPPPNREWGAEIIGETRSWTDFGPQAYLPYAEEPTGQCPEPILNGPGSGKLTATKFGLANGSGTFPPGNERCSQDLRASLPRGGESREGLS